MIYCEQQFITPSEPYVAMGIAAQGSEVYGTAKGVGKP